MIPEVAPRGEHMSAVVAIFVNVCVEFISMEAPSSCTEQIESYRRSDTEMIENRVSFQNKTPCAVSVVLDYICVATCGARPEVNESFRLYHTAV